MSKNQAPNEAALRPAVPSSDVLGGDAWKKSERSRFEHWMRQRGTPLAIEHPQAFDAWIAAKLDAAT